MVDSVTYRGGLLTWPGPGASGGATWNDVTGKPLTFAPAGHEHVIADITGLQTALDGKQDVSGGSGISVLNFHSDAGANLTLTNQTNVENYLAGSLRNEAFFDASNFTELRICAVIVTASASANTPRLYPQYWNGSAWVTIGSGTGTNIVSMASPTGAKKTDWIALPVGAKGDVRFRIANHGGDGAADPAIGNASLQFR